MRPAYRTIITSDVTASATSEPIARADINAIGRMGGTSDGSALSPSVSTRLTHT